MKLFEANHSGSKPIRSVGVRGADLVSALRNMQLSFLEDNAKEERLIRLESTIDKLRERFGHFSVQRALMLKDKPLTDMDPKNEHVIYPVAYK